MSQAHDGRALIEVAQFPKTLSKPMRSANFHVAWASHSAIAVPRALFDATGGYEGRLVGCAADVDLSWRARALGFAVLNCPRALFAAAQTSMDAEETMPTAMSLLLAVRWGNTAAEAEYAAALRQAGLSPLPNLQPVPPEWRAFAEFPLSLGSADESKSR